MSIPHANFFSNLLEDSLTEHRGREQTLRDTLLTAQRLSDEIRATAKQQARDVVSAAESSAEILVEKAHTRVEDMDREIEELRQTRGGVEREIQESVNSLHAPLMPCAPRTRRTVMTGSDSCASEPPTPKRNRTTLTRNNASRASPSSPPALPWNRSRSTRPTAPSCR